MHLVKKYYKLFYTKTALQLHIPKPCHENWDAMTPKDKGKHCQSCNKIVVDFSVMTDRQVLDYFKNTAGNICGWVNKDQLNRPLIEPQKQPSKWSYFLASILGLIISVRLAAQQKISISKNTAKPKIERNRIKAAHNDIVVKPDTLFEKTISTITTQGDKLVEKQRGSTQDEIAIKNGLWGMAGGLRLEGITVERFEDFDVKMFLRTMFGYW